MNKLISRNLVQRFKQGRKLIKAQFGQKVREDGVVVNSAGVPVRASGVGYQPSLNFSVPTKKTPEKKFSINMGNKKPQQTKNDITNNFGFLNSNQTQELIEAMANPVKKVSNTQRNPGAYHNITTWQNKLKDFYEPGKFAVDGIWGNNTEAAYQKYLQLVNVPEMSQEEAKAATTPRQVQFTNPVNLNSTPIQIPQTYNRTQIREFLRNKGVNPYSFSGDQRRAVRMVLNGQGTDEDKALVQSMGIFKKGGQLPSRNPITRFKNRKSN